MRLNIDDFSDLALVSPINHDRTLISRLPLYKKWFGEQNDFKNIFTRQVIEYITMGFLVQETTGPFSLLVASDHKAMRPYYNVGSSQATCGVTTQY